MSIERKPRFHSERVACTETARAEALGFTGVEKRLEQMLGARSVEKYLEPIFTGIASARHDTILDSSDCARDDAKARYGIERKFGYRRENRVSLPSLYRHQRSLGTHIVQLGAIAVEPDEPLAIHVDIRGVDAQHVMLRRKPIDDEIIDRAAAGRAHQRVLGLAVGEARRGICQRMLEQRERPRPAQVELAHVAQVENAGGRTHRQVLFDYAGVAERHLEAAKLRHSRAELAMQTEKGGVLDRLHPHHSVYQSP